MLTSTTPTRALKRKRNTTNNDPDSFFTPSGGRHGPNKRTKSENVSLLKRYLIGCAHLLWVKSDPRDFDESENLIHPEEPQRKAPAPSSDLPQVEMVALYFGGIDRTVVSQSKSKSHLFAPPDFSMLEPYLFPWIRVNGNNITRAHIKHIAFRIWEYFAAHGKVVLRYEVGRGQPENMPLGNLRGWWWESDGDVPRNYHAWYRSYDGNLPGISPF